MAIGPPLNASVCSRISQLLTSLSLYQLSSRQVSERSLSLTFSFCARTAMPVDATSAAISTVRPKNLYMFGLLQNVWGCLSFFALSRLCSVNTAAARVVTRICSRFLQDHNTRNSLQIGTNLA